MTSCFENNGLQSVIKHYKEQTEYSAKSLEETVFPIFDVFQNIIETDLTPIRRWLENQYKAKILKDNSLSLNYRKQGNLFYGQKKLTDSLTCYTKSLCFAEHTSEEYFIALSNRSAVTFEMGRFEDCLRDIELCLGSSGHPENLIPKIYLRKIECLQKLKRKTILHPFLKEVETFFDKTDVGGIPEKFIKKFNHLKNMNVADNSDIHEAQSDSYQLPLFENAENPIFAYASSRIEVRYNSEKGRHVVARQSILQGDILFIEKAFTFGPIFDIETQYLKKQKCYYCLKNLAAGIPCISCVQSIYCNVHCRDSSWHEFHRWECVGMQSNIWYHLGIAFPGLRTFLKGIFKNLNEERRFSNDSNCFGSKEDNYPYFNSLVFHAHEDNIDAVILAATVIEYLSQYTDFFQWYISQPTCIAKNVQKLKINFGKRLVKHILQLQNNSSVIEHWVDNEFGLPAENEPVACGIFPSVSIMNHSCKPNITNYFICDTIIVKALNDINENEEIFNCYGIDYKTMDREKRQMYCQSLYNFYCKCVVCSDPTQEMETLNNYLCPKCGYIVPDDENLKFGFCKKCRTNINLEELRKLNETAMHLGDIWEEKFLLSCLDQRKIILSEYHINLQETYFRLYQYYAKTADCQNLLKYFYKWIEIEEKRNGGNAYHLGRMLYEVGTTLIAILKSDSSVRHHEVLLSKVEQLLMRAKKVCSLYYPQYIIDRVTWE